MGDEPNKVAEEMAAEQEGQPGAEESPVSTEAEAPQPQTDDAQGSEASSPEPVESAEAAASDEPAEETAPEPVAEEPEEAADEEPEEAADEESEAPEPITEAEPAAKQEVPIEMDWYILKVQSNRERSIADALRRKIAIEGLDDYFGEVVVPTEKVTEFKGGKKKVVERKLYPGYIVVNMCITDDTWFAVRETSGIGDFTGAGGKPTPMLPHEVARIVQTEEEEQTEAPKLNIRFKLEDRVKIKEGTFEGFEGDVNHIDEASGRVTVMINIFGRSTPVEMEYWQIEAV